MKTKTKFVLNLLASSTALAAVIHAAPSSSPRLLNAYGEPAGFGNVPAVTVPNTPETKFSRSIPGTGGLYLVPGWVDSRHFESSGQRLARIADEARATVTIGELEVLDSGPTGPMAPDALAVAQEQATSQVLGRIKVTDHTMATLSRQAKALDPDTRAHFDAAASEVAARRQALREDLKSVRAINDERWSDARAQLSVSYNAYVQAMHQAEAIVPITANS